MMRAFALCLLLVLCGPSLGKTGGKGNGSPSVAVQMQAKGGGGSASLRALRDPRAAPPMDPTRKVSEQDCSKPVDLSVGNLKCK
jgi:hypothetical protein